MSESTMAVRRIRDVDSKRAAERERQMKARQAEKAQADSLDVSKKSEVDPLVEYNRLMELRSGGTYVPPARLRKLQAQMKIDKNSKEYQRNQWDELKRGINGSINKAGVENLKEIITTIFQQNLVRGRGLFCRSIMKAQAVSLSYTAVYSAMVAVINSKLPELGELLVKRLIIQFRRAFKRNDKPVCLSSSIFLGHLCNYQVAHEIVCLQILHLLLARPTDDSVEIAVGFARVVGASLMENSPSAANDVFERFRAILVEAKLEKRTQYMIEILFKIRKDGFNSNPSIQPELDLVDEEDQKTHMIGLDDELKSEDLLNVFRFDENYEENEQKYKALQSIILGFDSSEEGEDSESDASGSYESDSESESENENKSEIESENKNVTLSTVKDDKTEDGRVVIKDMTQSELANLRKTVYLTVMSTMSTQEVVHKLFKIKVPEGNEIEVVNMIVECCGQEKTYNKIYGGVGVLVCTSRKAWHDMFQKSFIHYFEIIHRYETNKLRNIATMFGFMLAKDALGWEVFECIVMTEEESTSASRIFVKIMLEEMKQELGVKKLAERFREPYIQPYLTNMLVRNRTAADTRFSINYFTAIGLGVLTEDLRQYLKELPPDRGRSVSRSSYTSSISRSGRSLSGSSSRSSYYSRSRSRSYSRSVSRSRSISRSSSFSSDSYSGDDRRYSRTLQSRERSDYSESSPPSSRRQQQRQRQRSQSFSRSPDYRERRRRRRYSQSPPSRRSQRFSRSPDDRSSYAQAPPERRPQRFSRSTDDRSSYAQAPPERLPQRFSRSPDDGQRRSSYSQSPPPRLPQRFARSPNNGERRRSRYSQSPPPRLPHRFSRTPDYGEKSSNYSETSRRKRINDNYSGSLQSKRPRDSTYSESPPPRQTKEIYSRSPELNYDTERQDRKKSEIRGSTLPIDQADDSKKHTLTTSGLSEQHPSQKDDRRMSNSPEPETKVLTLSSSTECDMVETNTGCLQQEPQLKRGKIDKDNSKDRKTDTKSKRARASDFI